MVISLPNIMEAKGKTEDREQERIQNLEMKIRKFKKYFSNFYPGLSMVCTRSHPKMMLSTRTKSTRSCTISKPLSKANFIKPKSIIADSKSIIVEGKASKSIVVEGKALAGKIISRAPSNNEIIAFPESQDISLPTPCQEPTQETLESLLQDVVANKENSILQPAILVNESSTIALTSLSSTIALTSLSSTIALTSLSSTISMTDKMKSKNQSASKSNPKIPIHVSRRLSDLNQVLGVSQRLFNASHSLDFNYR